MAGPELAAAVSNAGAFGVLGMGGLPAPYIHQQIQRLRTLTNKPFGVNLILPLLQEGQVETCLDEKVPVLILLWGDPKPYIQEAHRRGTKVFIQVGSVEEARAAAEAGVDWIMHADLATEGELYAVAEAGARVMPTMTFLFEALEVGKEKGRSDEELDVIKRNADSAVNVLQTALSALNPGLTVPRALA